MREQADVLNGGGSLPERTRAESASAHSRAEMRAFIARTSSEIVAELVSGARVVKAANTLPAELLGADPRSTPASRTRP